MSFNEAFRNGWADNETVIKLWGTWASDEMFFFNWLSGVKGICNYGLCLT